MSIVCLLCEIANTKDILAFPAEWTSRSIILDETLHIRDNIV